MSHNNDDNNTLTDKRQTRRNVDVGAHRYAVALRRCSQLLPSHRRDMTFSSKLLRQLVVLFFFLFFFWWLPRLVSSDPPSLYCILLEISFAT